MTVNQAALLKDLRKQVTALEDDLRERTESEPKYREALEAEYERARAAKRTAATYGAWRDDRVTQAAVAWVLATVFVRFCEDNGLIADAWIAGPGERLVVADERHQRFFREHPEKNDRDWLTAAFDHLAGTNETVAGLFDRDHNPLWELEPSYEAASDLLKFWRRVGSDGAAVHDFTDPDLETRFLGDLYEHLSKHAQEKYALRQTPEFVEEFILDLVLEPAVKEFGLEPVWKYRPNGWTGDPSEDIRGLRTIDPACGSGHFLLGIFNRLLRKWDAHAPNLDKWERIRRTLQSIHGCDKNPFAAGIARFRLLVAVLKAAGEAQLKSVPQFPINIAVGDSLLHGRGAGKPTDVLFGGDEEFRYRFEDVDLYVDRCDLLGLNAYHAVVANPPYITVKDRQEKENYKKAYRTCAGLWTLAVPFMERSFDLAITAGGSNRNAGFVGQLTSNAFMKREFGKKLVEQFLASVSMSYVIDTSGVRIPSHGTPTVILVGRNMLGYEGETVRVALAVNGDTEEMGSPEEGRVWRSIVTQIENPGFESPWIEVVDWPRNILRRFPWSLNGGGADDLVKLLEKNQAAELGDLVKVIGRVTHTGSDESYFAARGVWERHRVKKESIVAMVTGDVIRDWTVRDRETALFPYDSKLSPSLGDVELARILWPNRTLLRARREPAGSHEEIGLTWFEWSRWHPERFVVKLGIGMAFVASHPHFSLDRDGKVFNRSAPGIKLVPSATEDDHLGLLGILNSSVACFWLKYVSHDKGGQGVNEGYKAHEWERFYEFTGTNLKKLPMPPGDVRELAGKIDKLARLNLSVWRENFPIIPWREELARLRRESDVRREAAISLQEELDWKVYGLYGVLRGMTLNAVTMPTEQHVPPIELGQRAFEIVLARQIESGETSDEWFRRHGSTPITQIPSHWPEEYRRVVQARIDLIRKRPKDIGLLERPDHKRRWSDETWERKESAALRKWILDRCEREGGWHSIRDGFRQPRTLTIAQLADQFSGDIDMQSVAALYASDHLGKADVPLEVVLTELIVDQNVPYLAALRYTETGLRKRSEWEQVWEDQREEDRTGQRLDIALPSRYASKDFKKSSYWSQRGNLDVPKERFISYPGASPGGDRTLLLGWAGWDHKDQAQALVNIVNDRTEQAAWEVEKITPLLAGLLELMPWVHQWHGEYDSEWEGVPAEEFQAFLDEQRAKHQISERDLRDWRPVETKRGGRKKTE
ncbi:BREX-2 system adenine-specific DNA-methyltransferase PglX [Actinomadura oligospora]|uniref:BREX-2 system adenine-specific DNA-methyltransferase PglX n=1 Tax=Actinomadura oligospora TaxID=111804 RepID=UPI0004AF63ED|nr:BREX-2 system adenine-specific DNA-methyltransferase PglX [Actinomadura oligospora]